MDISYLGHSAFKIRGKTATVITDPYDNEMVGLKFPKHVSADIVTVSHHHRDHDATRQIEGSPYIVDGPGEYEVKGVSIVGIPSFHDTESGARRGSNTIYRIEVDDVSLAHLGDLGHNLTSSEIENLDGVDILCIPVGGIYTIDAVQAAEVIKAVEPAVVIPMHFGRSELNPQNFGNLAPLSVFLKEVGKESVSPQPKLTISKDKLPTELQVVVLA